ncbi:MAG: AAA family ATPase [Acidimicrobiia bacterium]
MRPVRLEVQGFGAFREPTVIDFDGVELFALVGPTGSGKSTVIDAMCFALYGSVPRYGNKGSVAPIVTMGAIEARVSLTFEAGGRRYIATRVVRRQKQGSATTKEARLEAVDGEVLAGSVGEIDGAVEGLLGLTFEHFTRAVVLPQNEFARFLHDKPAARQDLLIKLLGFDVYERMMRDARAQAAEHEAVVNLAEQQLSALADCTPDQLEIWKQWAELYQGLRKEVRAARAALTKLERDAAAAAESAARERDIVTRLEKVKVPVAVEKLAVERDAAEKLLDEAVAAAGEAAALVGTAQETLTRLGPRDALVAARAAYVELEQVRTARAGVTERAERADVELASAASALAAAEHALESLQVAHAAHALVGALAVGAPCPVCDQPVARVPKHRAPTALSSARKQLDAAKAADRRARETAAAAKQSATELDGRERALSRQVSGQPDQAEIDRQLVEIEAATAALETARSCDAAARKREGDARKALAMIDGRLQKAAAAFRAQRDALVQVGIEPPPERGDLASDWPALVEWARAETPTHEAASLTADAAVSALGHAREEQLGALVERAREAEIDVPAGGSRRPSVTPDELADVVVEAEQGALASVRRVTEGMKERARLEQEIERSGAEVHVARELARLLDARNFERWLVAEALELLVDGASLRLRELSAGQYSFAFEEANRDFLVVDHRNADERRSVRTLSGGETFQASLALALALADQLADLAADGAARLESIFLDEGFGSLDPDTLEVVAGTIENLGAGDRTVAVVTHVRDLADRMPVQYRVTKGPRTASVERVSR